MSEFAEESNGEHLQYRALSMSAIAAFVLGLMSIPSLIIPILLFIPAIGTITGLFALRTIRRQPEQLTGLPLAKAGLCLSLMIGVFGGGYTAFDYATEVPAGYARLSFQQLQPKEGSPYPIPPSAMDLNGQQIFIKGYVYPDGKGKGIKKFVLVPDMGNCCFGGQPKLTDMIEVTLQDPLRVNYSYARRKLAGTLKVSPNKKKVSGLDGVYYQLDADYVK